MLKGLITGLLALAVFTSLEPLELQVVSTISPVDVPLEINQVSAVPKQILDETEKLFSAEIAYLVNEYRRAEGLSPLIRVASLEHAASTKVENFVTSGQFAHRNEAIYGIEYFANKEGYRLNEHRLLGENLACGITNAEEVFNAWISSELHRKNILEPIFTDYGVGFGQGNINYKSCNGDSLIVVMAFGGKQVD